MGIGFGVRAWPLLDGLTLGEGRWEVWELALARLYLGWAARGRWGPLVKQLF